MEDYFLAPTKEHLKSYDRDVIHAVRTKDIEALRRMHESGRTLQCCNDFGESLVHMACRRGFTEVVSFLINEANVSLRVRDDFGRTPFHNACWTDEKNYRLLELLIKKEPMLLFVSDSRGHTPLHYVRKEHWNQWVTFLAERLSAILRETRMKDRFLSTTQ